MVADLLPDDELVFADLLIGISLALLREVDPHAAQELLGQGRDLLVELTIESLN